MTTATRTNGKTAPRAKVETAPAVAGPRLTLADLSAMDVAALGALYAKGTVPESLAALDGEPECRMLAVRGLDSGAAARALRALAASRLFPWAGKAFASDSSAAGSGVNRVRAGKELRLFSFGTRIESSAVDGKPCILLDYDRPANPFFIRAVRDELREVSPGLFLGPALLQRAGAKPLLALYFACCCR